MPARKKVKPVEHLGDVHVNLRMIPYVALVPDDPRLAGRTYFGKTVQDAFANARADATVFYKGRANVTLSIDKDSVNAVNTQPENRI
jgi:hypothetical protein